VLFVFGARAVVGVRSRAQTAVLLAVAEYLDMATPNNLKNVASPLATASDASRMIDPLPVHFSASDTLRQQVECTAVLSLVLARAALPVDCLGRIPAIDRELWRNNGTLLMRQLPRR